MAIIGIFLGVIVFFLHRAAVLGSEVLLQVELKSIRQSLLLYEAMNGKYPEDLRELEKARFRAKSAADEVIFGEEFLSTVGRDDSGYLIDPFGNRFHYEPKSGRIGSATEGYENW